MPLRFDSAEVAIGTELASQRLILRDIQRAVADRPLLGGLSLEAPSTSVREANDFGAFVRGRPELVQPGRESASGREVPSAPSEQAQGQAQGQARASAQAQAQRQAQQGRFRGRRTRTSIRRQLERVRGLIRIIMSLLKKKNANATKIATTWIRLWKASVIQS